LPLPHHTHRRRRRSRRRPWRRAGRRRRRLHPRQYQPRRPHLRAPGASSASLSAVLGTEPSRSGTRGDPAPRFRQSPGAAAGFVARRSEVAARGWWRRCLRRMLWQSKISSALFVLPSFTAMAVQPSNSTSASPCGLRLRVLGSSHQHPKAHDGCGLCMFWLQVLDLVLPDPVQELMLLGST
ncbi:unnamed protein product, partial [Urochloa humidicola]